MYQVETSSEILLVYRAHLVMIVTQNFSCRYAVQGCEKNYPKLERTVQIRATAHAHDSRVPSSGAVFAGAFELTAWTRPWQGCKRSLRVAESFTNVVRS
jgi:hypothetical protein